MQIQFQTKEKSNKQQQESFLKLSKVERIYGFLNLMYKKNIKVKYCEFLCINKNLFLQKQIPSRGVSVIFINSP